MSFLRRMDKRGHVIAQESIGWIIILAILIAVGFAVTAIVIKAGG